MAAEGETHEQMKAHAKSYSAFSSMMKWGTIITAIVTLIVVLIIAS